MYKLLNKTENLEAFLNTTYTQSCAIVQTTSRIGQMHETMTTSQALI